MQLHSKFKFNSVISFSFWGLRPQTPTAFGPPQSWRWIDAPDTTLRSPEAADLAQNCPLWMMMSTYGATQSWVACQKRRRIVQLLWTVSVTCIRQHCQWQFYVVDLLVNGHLSRVATGSSCRITVKCQYAQPVRWQGIFWQQLPRLTLKFDLETWGRRHSWSLRSSRFSSLSRSAPELDVGPIFLTRPNLTHKWRTQPDLTQNCHETLYTTQPECPTRLCRT